MEKMEPDAENTARTAADLTVVMAEEKLGINVAYRTYTAEMPEPAQTFQATNGSHRPESQSRFP